jgi:hypothetical protein
MSINGFMHVYATERGQEIVTEQIERLKTSGLWDATKKIFVCSVGPEPHLPLDDKIVHVHFDDAGEFERPTLAALHRECLAAGPNDRAWYIHTKGASWTANDPRYRRHMEASVIDNWRHCYSALDYCRTCGPMGKFNPEPIYAGNFWWARADYVKTLMEPYAWAENSIARGSDARMSCETWVVQNNLDQHLFLNYSEGYLNFWRENPI